MMGMRDEIEALPVSHDSNGWETIDRADVLRIIDKHAVPVVDITPGMQPRVVALFCEGCRKSVPFLHRHKGMMLCDPCINP